MGRNTTLLIFLTLHSSKSSKLQKEFKSTLSGLAHIFQNGLKSDLRSMCDNHNSFVQIFCPLKLMTKNYDQNVSSVSVCWFCNKSINDNDMVGWCDEFDTFYHSNCGTGSQSQCNVCVGEGLTGTTDCSFSKYNSIHNTWNTIVQKISKIFDYNFEVNLWSIILMTTNTTPKIGKPATSGQLTEIARKAPALFTGSASSIIYLMSAWGTLDGMGKYVANPTVSNLRQAVKEFKVTLELKAKADKTWREDHPIPEVKSS